MRNRALITLSLGLLVTIVAVGCNSAGNDPFTQWHAEQRFPNYVPVTAQPLAKGKGMLTCTTPAIGTLYLLDDDDMIDVQETKKPRLIGQGGQIPKGAEITFDPATGRVWAKGGQGVKMTTVNPSHTHELRFQATTGG